MCRRAMYFYCNEYVTFNIDEEGLKKRATMSKKRKGMAIVLLFGGKCGGNTEHVAKITAFCC